MFVNKLFKNPLWSIVFCKRDFLSLLAVAVAVLCPSTLFAGGGNAPFPAFDSALSAPSLRSSQPVRVLKNHAHLIEKIGGIVFENIARPAADILGETLGIEYLPEKKDGKRLKVSIGNAELFPPIFDWQLLPIAQYADAKATAVVTTTEESPNKIRFHPAFKNTLLGLRLFQADTLFDAPSSAWNLPRYYLPGDHTHWSLVNRAHIRLHPSPKSTVVQVVKKWTGVKVLKKRQGWFQVELGEKSGWISSDLLTRKSPPLLGGGESGFHTEKPIAMVEKIEAIRKRHYLSLRAKYGRGYRNGYLINDQKTDIEFTIKQSGFALTGLPEYYFWSARKDWTQMNPVVHMNFEMRQKIQLIEKINPVVFKALVTTMRYAAFFRYCKNENPKGWKSFLKSLEPVKIPSIEIPVTSIFHGNRYQPESG